MVSQSNLYGVCKALNCWNALAATRGVLPSTSGNGAYVILNVVPPKLTNLDRMRVAFQTYATDGPIARFMSPDGRFYEVYMVSAAFHFFYT